MNELGERLLQEYLNELKMRGKNVLNPRLGIRQLFEYLDGRGLDLLRLRAQEAEDYQTYLMMLTDDEKKPYFKRNTVCWMISSAAVFYRYLKRRKFVMSNPFTGMRRVQEKKRLPKNIFNEKDMEGFLQQLREFGKRTYLRKKKGLYRAHVIAELMYSTGMRIHEVMRLKPADLDLEHGTVLIQDSKTKRERIGYLNEYASRVLKIFIEDMREYILFGENGADMGLLFGSGGSLITRLNNELRTESKKYGKGIVTSHHFRHAVGYHLLRAGCDIRYIKEILGHKALSTTQVYTKVDKEDLKSVIDQFHPRVFRRGPGPLDQYGVNTTDGGKDEGV
jgi:integrase/recombinase XerD